MMTTLFSFTFGGRFKDQDDKFTVMAVKTPEEIKTLLEVGFEYICQKDDLVFLRKRK